ncbi:probable LRR receptor-like serine/threonine-protein kinase At1g34110 isoform X2 [Dendrobium catenatum]|uniref:probable LRR receptor-like serine/threonine-protein kinase At1g34110 isoform X2 n=1 Tax=Dendrobium catenatum TaxID=906689 RepID=UPI0010A01B47|nr:probable LRR receptor-like serine/threonine-protein kinase At1g34110 isoform X2 [Dendrobium catenatum]
MTKTPFLLRFLLNVFFFIPSSSLSPDGEALLSLLPSLPSPLLPSWSPSSSNPCSWQGITCSPSSKVISLSLPNTFLNLTSLPSSLSSLTSLQLLNLSSSNISGLIPHSLSSLSSLRILDLSSNSFTGPIPYSLCNLSSVQILFLHDNLLTGSVPFQFGSLVSLQQFRIGGNPFINGQIPPQLGLLTNLTTFGAAATGLSGPIPLEIGNLINLETLALYDTDISGSIPPELGSCSELSNLYLHMNKLTGSIPSEFGKLQKLSNLLLWGNSITGKIPWEISNCSKLVVLDLSANKFHGDVPVKLGRLAALEQLHLSDNVLSGSIPAEISNCSSLTALQLDKNYFSGSIPEEIGNLKLLQSLFLWGNSISGSIPQSFCNCSELYALDLSKNKLTGRVPDEIFSLKKLGKLLLLGNSLTGAIPKGIGNCQSLVRLRLSENQLSGEIPKDIVLELFDVHNNNITGEIPTQLWKLMNLEQLDLSQNGFTREIPSSFGNFSCISKLILNNNFLTGCLPTSIMKLQKLTLLDLSCNSLSGQIPPEIGSLTSLTISLDLSSNRFVGQIPEEMQSLIQLQSLDLSSNMLDGGIDVLAMLTSLTSLNISFNNFSGPIPVTPFFRTLSENSYLQNPNLCQSFDGYTCSSDLLRKSAFRSIKNVAIVCSVVGSAVTLLLVAWIIMSKNRKLAEEKAISFTSSSGDDFSYPWTFIPFQKQNINIDNILECLKEENVIGKGCSGIVYKAEMPNGELVAVKKLWRSKEDERVDAFYSEIQILGNIRHRNIVKLLGYCSNKSMNLLLYNYIPNGNLRELLQDSWNLDWETRYKIAVGAAQGLAYLHHDCIPAILHRDVKCNNILLDSKFEPYLADFGLAKLMNSTNFQLARTRIAGSYGYIAPEYGYTTNITEKSDVYSYGVVLLEILSGRSAIEPMAADGLHIVEWVKKMMGSFEARMNIIDSKLHGLPDQMVEEMIQTMGIAMFCVNSMPSERPTMGEVVALLKEVKCPLEEIGKTSKQPLTKPVNYS